MTAADGAADGGSGTPEPPNQPLHRLTPVEDALLITGSMLADTRTDFERGMRYGPPLTLTLIVVLVAVFAWQLGTGALESQEALIGAGALVRDRVLAGEVWRLVSAAFLHGSPDHLIGNVVSLYVLGLACEHALGATGMAIVYLASAIGGAVLSATLSSGPSVGASGAIFGLMSGAVLILHRERKRLYVRDKRIGVVIGVWAAYTFLLGALNPFVDNGAHLGGMIVGAIAAGLVPIRLGTPA